MNNKELFVYYRISDKGNVKLKIKKADKYYCLLNAISEFGKDKIFVLADNCEEKTITFLKKLKIDFERTYLGNSQSFIYLLKRVLKERKASDFVYLLEDDYFHLPKSKIKLLEGLAIADYVTLYDHPDKYLLYKDGGNPLNYKKLNTSRIYVTEHSHWRETDSTTMTFACSTRTIQEDFPIWEKYTNKKIPEDFRAFIELSQNKISKAIEFLFMDKRKEFRIVFKNWLFHRKPRHIISSIPSSATHVELLWLAPVVKWDQMI